MHIQGTVCWRARLETEQPLEQSSWFFGAEKVALLYPISDHHMVWTASAPIRLVEEAGVKFDPSNGGRFRASTQAVEGNDTALEVSFFCFCADALRTKESQCNSASMD